MSREEAVLRILGEILSFDRPVRKEEMVNEARDLLLVAGRPVCNDWRVDCRDSRRWEMRLEQELHDVLELRLGLGVGAADAVDVTSGIADQLLDHHVGGAGAGDGDPAADGNLRDAGGQALV